MSPITAIITETSGIQAHKYVGFYLPGFQNKQKVRMLQRSWKESRSSSLLLSWRICIDFKSEEAQHVTLLRYFMQISLSIGAEVCGPSLSFTRYKVLVPAPSFMFLRYVPVLRYLEVFILP